MTERGAIYRGWVMHRRTQPRRHQFRYRAFWLLIDIDALRDIDDGLRFFSVERFNLFSFRAADYGLTRAGLRDEIEAELASAGIVLGGGAIRLLTMPRVLGYAFNPISVFYCYRADETLAATIYEVHNTFGERHRYVIAADQRDGNAVRQSSDKSFHVSPFMPMELSYAFRASRPSDTLHLGISTSGENHDMHAVMKGERLALTDRALLLLFVTHPLITLKVIGAIHWEALRLWRKRLAVFAHRPTPPRVTVGLQQHVTRRSHG